MPNPTPESGTVNVTSKDLTSKAPASAQTVSPLKCFTGSLLAGSLALLLYRLMTAIALAFANHPAPVGQQLAYNLSIAVRTLVVGMATLATGIFSLAALGLLGLGLKLLLTRPAQG
jgi:hypothetical protein